MVVEDVEVPVDLSVFPPDFVKMTPSSSILFWSEPLVVSTASPLTEVSNIRVSVALPSFCFDDEFVDVGEFVSDGAIEVVDLLAFAFVTDLPAFFDLETVFALLMEVGAIVIVGAPDFFDFTSVDLPVFIFFGSEVDIGGRLSLLTCYLNIKLF